MLKKLVELRDEIQEKVQGTSSIQALQDLKVYYLGKKGAVTQLMKELGRLSPEERPKAGQLANELRQKAEEIVKEKMAALSAESERIRLMSETIDVTLPGAALPVGGKHLLTIVTDEIKTIFTGMGFAVAEGPQIELDYYNFERMNIPKEHPAREMQDSFYLSESTLLRTHTSPVQARTMDKLCPELPVKIIAPGVVYRRDDDATHSPMFHQVEGLLVDYGVTMADLKGTLLNFARRMFGEQREIRLRPSYFPFTEPSAEVDVSCMVCGGSGCRLCKNTGWIEILGSGMVHPKVLAMSGYDSQKLTGFAFGMGVERIAMLKYGVDDMRVLFENDLRFLKQF